MEPFAAQAAGALEFGKARLLAGIEDLSPQQLAAVPPGFSNSIASLVVHVAGLEVGMAHGILGRPLPEDLKAEYLRDRPQNPIPQPANETAATLTAKLNRARGILLPVLEGLKAADLTREVVMGPNRSLTVRMILVMLANHQMQHYGQIQMIKKFI
jgi:uncharacterized damage-inducible protein DinB